MDRLPSELALVIWKMCFRHVPLAVARCAVFEKKWRDARRCCKQAAAEGRYIAFLFAPNDVFVRSLHIAAKLGLPTLAQRRAAMIDVQDTNGRRYAALMEGPRADESEMDAIMRRKRVEADLVEGMLKALCHELKVALKRPWSDEQIKLVVMGFTHYNARMRCGLVVGRDASLAPWLQAYSLSPSDLVAYIRSYEEMVTSTEERERLQTDLSAGEDWITVALECGEGIRALREAGGL